MMPPQPLLQFTILRLGSKPRSAHAFQIQRYLSNGPKKAEGGFGYHFKSWRLPRKVLLQRLRFPRRYKPTLSKLRWTAKRIPKLLYTLVDVGVRWPMWYPRLPDETVGKVKSQIGRFFYDFVVQREVLDMLNWTMLPWGYFHDSSGNSMQPTLGGQPAILYSSYTYVQSRDISLGDVVNVLGPDYDKNHTTWTKRVAAFEGLGYW